VVARLVAAVLVPPLRPAPAGLDAQHWRRALLEDTYDAVAALRNVTVSLAVGPDPADADLADDVAWPGTARLPYAGDRPLAELLAGLGDTGAELGAVVLGDAPDLPGLLAGKLFSALEDAPCSVCPAAGGGLVGIAARLPAPDWLHVDLDAADALDRLHAVAPYRSVVVGAGWHRVRAPDDVSALDPGLDGWPRVRALLAQSSGGSSSPGSRAT
jgi:hypothetical protein